MAKTKTVLITFVGNRDPYPLKEDEPGPVLSFLVSNPVDAACLLCSSGDYLEKAKDLEAEAVNEGILCKFYSFDFSLKDVVDYNEIWIRLNKVLIQIRQQIEHETCFDGSVEYLFLLDSGTPQMKTCLLLTVILGNFKAKLFQGIPPYHAGGTYKARAIEFSNLALPKSADKPILAEQNYSLNFQQALERAVRVAKYDDPVLLLGETGTGKTMVARQIHQYSARKSGPFIEINCSTIPAELAGSELFGHVRGAFSGAEKNRSGKFKAASGGTLFLDEIGDLSMDLQVKLLKAIEEKMIFAVGSDEPQRVDVRIIAATNQDLAFMIKNGTFRRDLYERLKVMVIQLPPLRERKEEIPSLANLFIQEWNDKYGEQKSLSEEVITSLNNYSWPGNIRELRNALYSAAATAVKYCIEKECLPEEIKGIERIISKDEESELVNPEIFQDIVIPPGGINLRARLLQLEWSYVSSALRKTNWNREAAARLLGMTGHSFRKALKERLSGFMGEQWEEEC